MRRKDACNEGHPSFGDLQQRITTAAMLVRVVYSFWATSGNELSIHAAERLALIEGRYNSETGSCWGDSGWVRVATLDGQRGGFVPASYVTLDTDDDEVRQLRLLKAKREAEQAQEVGTGEAARAAAAAEARAAKRVAIRQNATAAKAEAKAAAVKALAAGAAAAAAQAEVDALEPSEASQAAEAPDDYDSSRACREFVTNRELKELCARHGINTSSALERADLIALAQPCLPTLDPTPAAPAPAPGQLPMAAARPVFQKDYPQEAHLRKAGAYFQTQPEEKLLTSADSGAEGPSKRHKAYRIDATCTANPAHVRLPRTPTQPPPAPPHSSAALLVFWQANLFAGVDPSSMSVRELKQRLISFGICLDDMIEKSDLVARLTACLVAGGFVTAQTNATLPPAETASDPPSPPLPVCSAHTSTKGAWVPNPSLPSAMTAAEAHRLAEAEGLSLVLAPENASGYKGVSRNNREKSGLSPNSGYCAQFCQGGRTLRLGSFSGAPEAALAYARHLKAVSAWRGQEYRSIQTGLHLPSIPIMAGTPAPVEEKERQQEWQQQVNMHAYSWLHAWRPHHQVTSAPAPSVAAPHSMYPTYVPMPLPGAEGAT